MMSHGEKLKVLNERGELAPDEFCEQIIKFEKLVFEMRNIQGSTNISIIKMFDLEDKVDQMLSEMGYSNEDLF